MNGEEHESYTVHYADDSTIEFFTDTYHIIEDTAYEELFIQEYGNPDTVIASDTYMYLEDVR